MDKYKNSEFLQNIKIKNQQQNKVGNQLNQSQEYGFTKNIQINKGTKKQVCFIGQMKTFDQNTLKHQDIQKQKCLHYQNVVQNFCFFLRYERDVSNQFIQDYKEFISEYENLTPIQIQQILKQKYNITSKMIQKYGIIISFDDEQSKIVNECYRIIPLRTLISYERIQYKLYISRFQIPISVKIVREQIQDISKKQLIYGCRYYHKHRRGNNTYCLNMITFRSSQFIQRFFITDMSNQFEAAIKQIGIHKLLQVFKISPKLYQIQQGIDIIIYGNCACFLTQWCIPLSNRMNDISLKQTSNKEKQKQRISEQIKILEKSIQQIIFVLFSLNISYKKGYKKNIVYNQKQNRYFLTNFNQSCGIQKNTVCKQIQFMILRKFWEKSMYSNFTDYYLFRIMLQRISKQEIFYAQYIYQINSLQIKREKPNFQQKKHRYCCLIKPLLNCFDQTQILESIKKKQLSRLLSDQNIQQLIKSVQNLLATELQEGQQSFILTKQKNDYLYLLLIYIRHRPISFMQYNVVIRKLNFALLLKKMLIRQDGQVSQNFNRLYNQLMPQLLQRIPLSIEDAIKDVEYPFIEYYEFLYNFSSSNTSDLQSMNYFKAFQKNHLTNKNIQELFLKFSSENLIFLRKFNAFTIQNMDWVLSTMRQYRSLYNQKITVDLLINCSLMILKQREMLPLFNHKVKQYLTEAKKLFSQKNICSNNFFISVKGQFIEMLSAFCDQNEQNIMNRIMKTKAIAMKNCGVRSYLYQSAILNEAYLKMDKPQCNQLIRQFIQNNRQSFGWLILGNDIGNKTQQQIENFQQTFELLDMEMKAFQNLQLAQNLYLKVLNRQLEDEQRIKIFTLLYVIRQRRIKQLADYNVIKRIKEIVDDQQNIQIISQEDVNIILMFLFLVGKSYINIKFSLMILIAFTKIKMQFMRDQKLNKQQQQQKQQRKGNQLSLYEMYQQYYSGVLESFSDSFRLPKHVINSTLKSWSYLLLERYLLQYNRVLKDYQIANSNKISPSLRQLKTKKEGQKQQNLPQPNIQQKDDKTKNVDSSKRSKPYIPKFVQLKFQKLYDQSVKRQNPNSDSKLKQKQTSKQFSIYEQQIVKLIQSTQFIKFNCMSTQLSSLRIHILSQSQFRYLLECQNEKVYCVNKKNHCRMDLNGKCLFEHLK